MSEDEQMREYAGELGGWLARKFIDFIIGKAAPSKVRPTPKRAQPPDEPHEELVNKSDLRRMINPIRIHRNKIGREQCSEQRVNKFIAHELWPTPASDSGEGKNRRRTWTKAEAVKAIEAIEEEEERERQSTSLL